jgi:hypothetical protein
LRLAGLGLVVVGLVVVLASACRRAKSQLSAGREGRAGALVGPGLEHQDDALVEGSSPGVALAGWVVLAFAVLEAGAAELAEGD